MNSLLHRHIAILTPHGKRDATVVGFEAKDTSRSGTGDRVPFVCLAVDGQTFWRWLPADAVTRAEPKN